MHSELSRRAFIGGTAVGIAAAYASTAAGAAPGTRPAGGGTPKTRIRKIYLAKPVPSWPKPSLDLPDEMKRIDTQLAGLADRMEGIELEGGELYRKPEDVPS